MTQKINISISYPINNQTFFHLHVSLLHNLPVKSHKMSFQILITKLVKTLYEKFVMVVRHMELQDQINRHLERKNTAQLAGLQHQIDKIVRKSLIIRTPIKSRKNFKSRIASSLTSRHRFKNQLRISFTELHSKEDSDSHSCYLDQSHGRICVANNKLEMAQQNIIKLQIENNSERDQLQSVIAFKSTELEDVNAKLAESRKIHELLQQSYQALGVHFEYNKIVKFIKALP
jgi:hypothetical protein